MPGKWLQSVACLGILAPVDSLDLGPRKVRLFIYLQQIFNLYNSVGMCNFVGIPFGPLPLSKLVDGINAATGWETSLWELLKVGERAGTMARVFNTREGLSANDDTLPERLFSPLEGGPLQGVRIDKDQFRQALKDYYQMAGWDPDTGIPTKAKLEELDLGEICRT